MRFSARTRYGLRFLVDLAIYGGEGRSVTLKDASKRQGISGKYLWHVAARLKSSGLVKAVRGSRGGFELAATADRITLKDILQALEGDIVTDGRMGTAERFAASCEFVGTEALETLNRKLAEITEEVTLSALARKQKARQDKAAFAYTI